MEQIYTVKVRCEPCGSQQSYPSEQAYSSSTVGGLASLHLILSLFGSLLLLPAVTNSGEFAIVCFCLLTGGVAACITGILASKLWYIDRYIKWFLYASSLSVITASISVLLVSVLALRPAWEPFLEYHNISLTALSYTGSPPLKQDVFFHVFLSAFLEFLLSLQSAKIASDGVKNTRAALQSTPPRTLDRQDEKLNCMKLPDYSDVVKELCRLQKNALLADGGELGKNIVSSLYTTVAEQHLPRPETQKEYKERMEKFLSAQYENDQSLNKD